MTEFGVSLLGGLDAPYDWLFAYSDVDEVITFLIPDKNIDILMIGCGNAPFSYDM